ncbi:DUF429 domain-containing protein [Rubripirellula reticaptiva]|uniref:DUF429 domain-containing protein n=1 Tax=Rubripirellula reticaptiva TaxID=2528013 RepID=A0A5C6ETK7_9BACT|nr:DUF429 domain-containing protein [Rubripirellula reticaptiva]TWU51417.1 hypothetical protein Poly59_30090 [Rubripirellula reticaptiva]
MTLYLGVDVAGANNTWAAVLSDEDGSLAFRLPPHSTSLPEIVSFADSNDVSAVAIDAQLTVSLSDLTGFRSSDMELRALLPDANRNWVASVNSLMAVPVRGQMLAVSLSTTVPTVIETHPRACLHFACGPSFDDAIMNYKREPGAADCVSRLWDSWSQSFGISGSLPELSDGALDAAVCATIAYLCHTGPSRLYRLRHHNADRTGHGPFVVLAPELKPTDG